LCGESHIPSDFDFAFIGATFPARPTSSFLACGKQFWFTDAFGISI
jgi:hypothetical protein